MFAAAGFALAVVAGGTEPGTAVRLNGLVLGAGSAVGLVASIIVAFRQVGITRARTAELDEQVALNRLVLDTASDAVLTLDDDGRILDANVEAERLFGDKAALSGRHAVDAIVAPNDRRIAGAGARSGDPDRSAANGRDDRHGPLQAVQR